jgi:hypothetical protein
MFAPGEPALQAEVSPDRKRAAARVDRVDRRGSVVPLIQE